MARSVLGQPAAHLDVGPAPAEQLEEINEWLSAIAREFPNLQQIEVVNEPLHDLPDKVSAGNTTATGGSGGYYEALGGAGVTG